MRAGVGGFFIWTRAEPMHGRVLLDTRWRRSPAEDDESKLTQSNSAGRHIYKGPVVAAAALSVRFFKMRGSDFPFPPAAVLVVGWALSGLLLRWLGAAVGCVCVCHTVLPRRRPRFLLLD
jgi:hypothetical protein